MKGKIIIIATKYFDFLPNIKSMPSNKEIIYIENTGIIVLPVGKLNFNTYFNIISTK